MSTVIRRKDRAGHVLHTGEIQRKNGTYEYRYTDATKKRRSIYAPTLTLLRQKERDISLLQRANISYTSGSITVRSLVERYLSTRRDARPNTQTGYHYVLSILTHDPLGDKRINTLRVSDAKLWLVGLSDSGLSRSTICTIRGVLRPAFSMACEDGILFRNPFDFRLDFLRNDEQKRTALTPDQEQQLLSFIAEDPHYRRCWHELVILLNTGLRIGEFTGLTMADLDFTSRKIHVTHQLIRTSDGQQHIAAPKSACGYRTIPMTDIVYRSLCSIIAQRPDTSHRVVIDGHSDFLFIDAKGLPHSPAHLQHIIKRICTKYNSTHTPPLPKITPHTLRHTFCTRLATQGMDIKSLQYLMGHSDASVTLNVYAHSQYTQVETAMSNLALISDDPFASDDLSSHP